MPLIAGGEMHKVLKARQKFTEDQVKFYIAQVIVGIDVLHKSGIMHRDLKLENLMIDSDGYLKIIDFGLAKILRPGQLAMTSCGTPAYMAPEVLRGDGYDFTADWWSVGVIMYEMLYGVNPFAARSIAIQT